MKVYRALRLLMLSALILSATESFSRGGETGTLGEVEDKGVGALDALNGPAVTKWSPYFIHRDHFRRLRARLSTQPLAPIPGWESQRAWRFQDKYFTEDGFYELIPFLMEAKP